MTMRRKFVLCLSCTQSEDGFIASTEALQVVTYSLLPPLMSHLLVQAYLARKVHGCFGLVIKLPHKLQGDAEAHFVSLLQSMLKVTT